MSEFQIRIDKINRKSNFVEIMVAVIIAIGLYLLIDSLVEDILLPWLNVIFMNNFESFVTINDEKDLGVQSSVFHHGGFVAKALMLIFVILCFWLYITIYKRKQIKNERINSSKQELSSGDMLHVEMRDLLKNLVEIRDLLKEKSK